MPLCPGLYPGRISICSRPSPLCDQWAWAVVTGTVWQIDHDESQGWKPGSVSAGPGQAMDDAGPGKQRALWTALASALGPLRLGPSCASEHFLPLSFYQQIQSLIKGQGEKRGREERGDREVKRAREIDVCVGGKREKTTSRSLSDRGGSCSGRGTCVPAASQSGAKLRPSARRCQIPERLLRQHPWPTVWNKQPFNLIWREQPLDDLWPGWGCAGSGDTTSSIACQAPIVPILCVNICLLKIEMRSAQFRKAKERTHLFLCLPEATQILQDLGSTIVSGQLPRPD